MRCLLVEDEAARIAAILPDLRKYFGASSVDVAEDRDTAKALIETRGFDLVVLDQRIPSSPGQLDPDVNHGRAVFEHLQAIAPDTVVFFLTALPMNDDYVDHLIGRGRHCDVFGDGKSVPLISRFQKVNLQSFIEAVERLAAAASVTYQIEINTFGKFDGLSDHEKRLIRCYGRIHNGVCVDVAMISEGLSGALVIKADAKDAYGDIRMSAVGKIGPQTDISREIANFNKEVGRLPAGTYAPLISSPEACVVGKKAAFYRLLEGHDESLFQVLKSDEARAADCVLAIKSAEESWSKKPTVRKTTVSELARMLIWSDRMDGIHALLDGVEWQSFEASRLSTHMCTRHGDLHGENARANLKQNVMLLDYGAVDVLPSAIDAVTLELSPFFHPHGPYSSIDLVSKGSIDWFDRGSFIGQVGLPNFIGATRDWAHSVAFGEREVLACAYIYILRQLQYPNANVALARSFLEGIIRRGLTI